MKKENIIIQISKNNTDTEGYVLQTWQDVVNLKGVLLPYGQELALKEYGYNAPVKYRAFNMRKINQYLQVGNRVLVKGIELFIVFVADYGKVQDILLDTEMPKAGDKSG
jgi:hypothetical protein